MMILIFKWILILSSLSFQISETSYAKTSSDSNTVDNIRKEKTESIPDWMQFFPDELSFVELGESTKEEIIKKLGKPLDTDGNQNLFYELRGIKYDITIGIEENKISHIIYSPTANSLFLKDLKPYIPQHILDQASQKQSSEESAHSFNRSYDITWPAQGITITVRKNSRESIETLLYFK